MRARAANRGSSAPLASLLATFRCGAVTGTMGNGRLGFISPKAGKGCHACWLRANLGFQLNAIKCDFSTPGRSAAFTPLHLPVSHQSREYSNIIGSSGDEAVPRVCAG